MRTLVLEFFYFLIKMVVLVFGMKFLADVLKTLITVKYGEPKEKEPDKPPIDDRFRFRQ